MIPTRDGPWLPDVRHFLTLLSHTNGHLIDIPFMFFSVKE
jgi:hypothetical protein